MLTPLQPPDNLVVNAMNDGGQMRVGGLRSAVAVDDCAIGSIADRGLLSGVIQTSHFKGVTTVFDPTATFAHLLDHRLLLIFGILAVAG